MKSNACRIRLVVTAAVALLLAVAPGRSLAETCRGKDFLAELKTTEPELHAQIQLASRAVPNTEAMLWRIDKPGVKPSYLFGTAHVTDERITKLSPRIRSALHDATLVLLEVADLSPKATATAMAEAAGMVLYEDGSRLDAVLTSDEFAIVRSTIEAAGMPVDLAAQFRPWIIYMLLSVSTCERRKVQEGTPVLDMSLAQMARNRGIPVGGLETVREQLASMASVPDPQQIDMLRATLKYARRTDDLMETVIQLYLKRQMGAAWPFQLALARKAGIDPTPLAVFQKEVVVRRNHKMRDGSIEALDKGGAFIAVGALHLSGKEGLVALYREAGYTVEPVE